jgi:hypothetical protein
MTVSYNYEVFKNLWLWVFLGMGIQVMSSVRRVFDLEITAGSGYLKKKTESKNCWFLVCQKAQKNCQVS